MRTSLLVSSAFALFSLVAVGCGGGSDGTANAGYATSDAQVTRTCGASASGAVQGVDVSYYQGAFDWSSANVAFGYARLSDGDVFADPRFDANWAGMKAAGVLRGAYQFFRANQDAKAQAQMVVDKLGVLGEGDLPAMIDVEVTGGVAPATIAKEVQVWLDIVEAGTGKTPIIYTGSYFWQDNVRDTTFGRYPMWIAAYGPSCPSLPAGWSSWVMWQYSDGGGKLDHDVWNGSLSDLHALAGAATSSPAAPASGAGSSASGGSDPSAASGSGASSSGSGASTPPPPPSNPATDCYSNTLGKSMPQDSCVVSKYDSLDYQCVAGQWYGGVSNGAGPDGPCLSQN